MTKTFLVTGGAGFIGSHLCERLLEDGNRVICIDNFITGSKKNIEHLLKKSNFKLIVQDVSQYIDIDDKIDFIFHFASPASPIDYLKLPIQTLKVGSLGTHKALGVAKSQNAGFLLASTSEVYGDPLIHPQNENYWGNVNPVGPRGVYDEAKRFAEAMTIAYHQYHNINVKIVRIFNTFGPRMRLHDGRVVPAFISQALENKEITVFGDGSQTRSFCFISDLIDGIIKLSNSDYNYPVNIGNPKEMSIIDFAKFIKQKLNSSSKITFKPLPIDDPKIRKPDITLAKKLLNWEPKVSLEDGITYSIEYFKNKLNL